jgi:protein-tyrosine phosphatase
MVAEPYWINAQLAIVPRPGGRHSLDDEMLALREAGIDVVVSMLEKFEAVAVGLGMEEAAATHAGLEFINFPIPDHSVPAAATQFAEFVADLEARLAQGRRIGIHCFGCIGRSTVVAASLLIRSGIPAGEAWNQIENSRGCPVPDTLEQLEWVDRNIRPLP